VYLVISMWELRRKTVRTGLLGNHGSTAVVVGAYLVEPVAIGMRARITVIENNHGVRLLAQARP
jgi:hypothetical protein